MTAAATSDSPAYEAATSLLDAALQALAEAGRPTPAEFFVSPGAPAFDCCDLLVVQVGRVRPLIGRAEQGRGRVCGVVWGVDATLWLVRCVTLTEDGEPTPGEEQDADAHCILLDADALFGALSCHGLAGCWGRGVGGYSLEGPRGGCLAVKVPVVIPIGLPAGARVG